MNDEQELKTPEQCTKSDIRNLAINQSINQLTFTICFKIIQSSKNITINKTIPCSKAKLILLNVVNKN